MNPISRIINSLIITTNRLVMSLNRSTIRTIRQGFYFLIFALAVTGIIIGSKMGKDAAKIKSSPLIEKTNDAFDLDVKRERDDASFSTMLKSDLINELQSKDISKIDFPSRDRLEPEIEKGLVEPESSQKMSAYPDMRMNEPVIEGRYRPKSETSSDVRLQEKKPEPKMEEKGTDIRETGPEIQKPVNIENNYDAGDKKMLPDNMEKDNIHPKLMIRDKGLIKN